MAYYRVCPLCNSTLDPQEICNCQEETEQLARKYELLITVTDNGQTTFNFKEETQWEITN